VGSPNSPHARTLPSSMLIAADMLTRKTYDSTASCLGGMVANDMSHHHPKLNVVSPLPGGKVLAQQDVVASSEEQFVNDYEGATAAFQKILGTIMDPTTLKGQVKLALQIGQSSARLAAGKTTPEASQLAQQPPEGWKPKAGEDSSMLGSSGSSSHSAFSDCVAALLPTPYVPLEGPALAAAANMARLVNSFTSSLAGSLPPLWLAVALRPRGLRSRLPHGPSEPWML